ncbi:TIGR00266 family protein [uncultured Methanobrevibacter sp.]|uniref:TIGR00266 family protein n=1 Tax=uncultured Methanobrevibacter sp. TaxID=253161 RepID=UPI0025D2F4B6|nr:TIGR00266 family protein [uncultured Methanobrevibacter sp.]MDO5810849.1 TIGR00266 family protein [Methanobrevibacter sp.]
MEYKIIGGAFPMVVCTLRKGETMQDETGAMSYMTEGIKMETSTGGGLLKGLGRALSGDTIFLNYFTAEEDNAEVAFSSCYPGKIIPIELNGNSIIGQKNAFLTATKDVKLEMHFRKKLGAGIFGGEGFILQRFSGNGTLFLEIDGDVIEKTLAPGERLLVDQGHVAAMDDTVDFDIQRVKGVKNLLFGGEGLFFATVTGPGRVWLQTMPVSKLAEAIIPFIPTKSD